MANRVGWRIAEWSLLLALFGLTLVGAASAHRASEMWDRVWWLTFSPDGHFLARGSDRGVVIFDTATAKPVATALRRGRDRFAVFSADSCRCAIVAWDRAEVLDLIGGASIRSFDSGAAITTAALDTSGARIAVSGQDAVIRVHDVSTGALTHSFQGITESVNPLAFAPDGNTLATASADRSTKSCQLRVLSLADGSPARLFPIRRWVLVKGVEFVANGSMLFVFGPDDLVRLATGEVIESAPLGRGDAVPSLSGCIRGDGGAAMAMEFVYRSASVTPIIVEIPSGRPIARLEPRAGWFLGGQFVDQDRVLMTASENGVVDWWDASTGAWRSSRSGFTLRNWAFHWSVLLALGACWLGAAGVAWWKAPSGLESQSVRMARPAWHVAVLGGLLAFAGVACAHSVELSGQSVGGWDPIAVHGLMALAQWGLALVFIVVAVKSRTLRRAAITVAATLVVLGCVTVALWGRAVASV